MPKDIINGRVLTQHTKSHALPPPTHYIVQKRGKYIVRKYQAKPPMRMVHDIAFIETAKSLASTFRLNDTIYQKMCQGLRESTGFHPIVQLIADQHPNGSSNITGVIIR